MKVQLFTSLLLTLIAGFASAASNREICQKKNPRVITAIDIFCRNSGLTVPSLYAKTGVHFGPNGAQSPNDLYLNIEGSCSPAQWVPQQYCLSQFYAICAQGSPRGGATRKFGRNGCQNWRVRIVRPGIKIVPVT